MYLTAKGNLLLLFMKGLRSFVHLYCELIPALVVLLVNILTYPLVTYVVYNLSY